MRCIFGSMGVGGSQVQGRWRWPWGQLGSRHLPLWVWDACIRVAYSVPQLDFALSVCWAGWLAGLAFARQAGSCLGFG
jgi:hypothetical protein